MYFLLRFVLDQCCVSSKISSLFSISWYQCFIHLMLDQAGTIKDEEGTNSVKAKHLRYWGMYKILYMENKIFSASGRIPGGNRICQAVPEDTARSLLSIWSINFHSSNCSDKHEMKIRSDRIWLQPFKSICSFESIWWTWGQHSVPENGIMSRKIQLRLLLNYL